MMSAKMSSLGFLKIKVFLNKDYNIIVSAHDVINRISLRDLDYIVDVVMWPKFGKSNISIREVIITLILLWGFDQKNNFFWGDVLIQGQLFGTGTKSYASVAKRLKLEDRKFLGLITTFAECAGVKLVGRRGRGGCFLPHFPRSK